MAGRRPHAWTCARPRSPTRCSTAAQRAAPSPSCRRRARMPPMSRCWMRRARRRAARALAPEPWLPDRARAANALAKAKFASHPQILWLSDDVDDGDAAKTADALSKIGTLEIFADARDNGPLALKPESNQSDGFTSPSSRGGARRRSRGAGRAWRNAGNRAFPFPPTAKAKRTAQIVLPLEVRNETARIAITGEDSAGAVRLLDAASTRRAVGLVSASNAENEQPLLSDLYYLERALAPYADVQQGHDHRCARPPCDCADAGRYRPHRGRGLRPASRIS